MSYLGFPRINFLGTFQADPSTVNNDPVHYDSSRFVARFQERQTAVARNGWWNPNGSGAFRLGACAITSLSYPDGSTVVDPAVDGLLRAKLIDAQDRVSAKMVDLDPQQQIVSEIWGLRLLLTDGTASPTLVGDFKPAAFRHLWSR